jgi:hypothetical protein
MGYPTPTPMHSPMGTGTGVALPVALGVDKDKEHVTPAVYASIKVKVDVPMVDTSMNDAVLTGWAWFKVFVGTTSNVLVVSSIVGTTFITVIVASSA